MTKPLAIDLFCGLGGWTEGFLAEGYGVIGFDIERRPYAGQLVLQDVLTLHGSQFKKAAVIVASPPCQAYSYRAMPWGSLWLEHSRMDDDGAPAGNYQGKDPVFNDLFYACLRIAREAGVPVIIENVKGAQKHVGPARWHFGSFYLWGDVPALMPFAQHLSKDHGLLRSQADTRGVGNNPDGRKVLNDYAGHGSWKSKTGEDWRSVQNTGTKQKGSGAAWFDRALDERRKSAGAKNGGDWFGSGQNALLQRRQSSKGTKRALASAEIAKIPFELARHIAATFKPQ